MDGTLELLIGIAIGILACVVAAIWAIGQYKALQITNAVVELQEALKSAIDRVGVLERRKAVISEAVASQPKPAGVKLRRFSEDLEPVDSKS